MGMPVIVTSEVTRCDAITDIIQSVALQQAALSHILNAEGEKIQYMIASDCTTPEHIMEANNSVRSMVDSVAKLELILQYKLSLFEDSLCDPLKHPKAFTPPCPKHNCTCSCSHQCEH